MNARNNSITTPVVTAPAVHASYWHALTTKPVATMRARALVTRPVSDRTLIIDRGSLSDPLGTIKAADPEWGPRPFYCPPTTTHTSPKTSSTDRERDDVLSLAQQAAQARTNSVPCRTYDADLWFAEDQASTDKAQRLCQRCPLQAACLSEALARQEPAGVWGRGTVRARADCCRPQAEGAPAKGR